MISKCNAEINLQNKRNETPLVIAVKEGKFLICHNHQMKNIIKNSQMCLGRKEIVDFLLENYALINLKNADGNTALHLAVEDGKY